MKPTDKPEIEGDEITILENKPISPKIIVLKQKKVVMKNLVDNISRNMLIRYFNLWRRNLPEEDREALERRARNSI